MSTHARHARTTPAERAVAEAAGAVAPIGLVDLDALAALQTRVDRKYFVPARAFRRLIAGLAGELQVLEIEQRRSFGYESVYFDTTDLSNYRAHVQRRRHRFKARTRTYTDSGLCVFEVKLTGARGETVKQRMPYPAAHRYELTATALAHLDDALSLLHHRPGPMRLRPTLVTTYERTTFVARTGEARLTCDVDLTCLGLGSEVRDTGAHVLVESKSARGDGTADRVLRELGIRPASVSKYCVGVAALHPDLPSNPWHQTLRRYFAPVPASA